MMELLDAVDALTKEEHEHLAQKNDEGRWLKAHTVTHPCLLQRMHDAVTPSTGRDSSSKSSASTRSPVDVQALFEYAKMTAQIKDWCLVAGVATDRDPVVALRRWYVSRLAERGRDDAWHVRMLAGWANLIRDHLNPPRSFTITAPCPVCGTTGYGDAINGGDTWPIEVRYRLNLDGAMADEVARCRFCQVAWQGHDAVVELADELNEKVG